MAAGTAGYILSNQRFYLPAWVPGIGSDFYTVEAEFETGQAVVPGQGQTVNIAGVKVGDIGEVELEDGVAVVELNIQDKYKPIYRDAHDAAAPEDRPEGHVRRARPGHAGRRRAARGRHDRRSRRRGRT